MIDEIAQAAVEQAEGVHQVHQAITQIDGVTQQNAALVEETSSAAESLSEQANILQSEMAFFHIGNVVAVNHQKNTNRINLSQKGSQKPLNNVLELKQPKNNIESSPVPKLDHKPSSRQGQSMAKLEQWEEF